MRTQLNQPKSYFKWVVSFYWFGGFSLVYYWCISSRFAKPIIEVSEREGQHFRHVFWEMQWKWYSNDKTVRNYIESRPCTRNYWYIWRSMASKLNGSTPVSPARHKRSPKKTKKGKRKDSPESEVYMCPDIFIVGLHEFI